jgi:hypothetical protein
MCSACSAAASWKSAHSLSRLDNEIAGGGGGREAVVVPVCSPALTAQEAEHEWRRLADWVATVLGSWYRVAHADPQVRGDHRPRPDTIVWSLHG